jgi:hypothetical protein
MKKEQHDKLSGRRSHVQDGVTIKSPPITNGIAQEVAMLKIKTDRIMKYFSCFTPLTKRAQRIFQNTYDFNLINLPH